MNNCSSGDSLDFSDAEIRSELSRLGYNDIDPNQFQEFKKDLITLVQADRSSSFSSQQSKTQYPLKSQYSSSTGYDHLYRPPTYTHVAEREKENADSLSRPYRSAHERRPLRDAPPNSNSNSSAYRTDRLSPHKPSRYYGTNAASRSLPRCGETADYYRQVEQLYDRPKSAGEYREYSDVYEDGDDFAHRHLDDYWYGTSDRREDEIPDNYYTSQLPPEAHTAPRVSDSHDYTTASDFSQNPKDDDVADTLADKLNLSRASQSSMVRRKVSRRLSDGTSHVYEESYMQEDAGSGDGSDADSVTSDVGGLLKPTYINYNRAGARPSSRSNTEVLASRTRPPSTRYDKSVDPVKSAVIWPEAKPVTSRNTMKTDPVSKYQQYQQEWSKSKVPEEKKHKNLRWAVREQMLYKDIIYEKPQKKFVANTYVVPTDKKRKDLRWRIRADMAAGMLPNSS